MTDKITIEDGIYEDVPFADYLRWDRMSKSVLGFGRKSMFTLKAKVDGVIPDKRTDALDFGTAFDCKLLTPSLFQETYTVAETCSAIKKGDGKPCEKSGSVRHDGQWYCGTHKPKEGEPDDMAALSKDNWDKAHAMHAVVMSHPIVQVFRAEGGCQTSMAWTDPGSGIQMRGRLDKLVNAIKPLIVDVKTCASLDLFDLSRDFIKFGYHIQNAAYRAGMKILTGIEHDMIFVYAEKEPPYEVAVFRPDTDTINLGILDYHNLLGRWANCLKTGVYPMRWDSSEVHEMRAPEYKLKVLETVNLDSLAG